MAYQDTTERSVSRTKRRRSSSTQTARKTRRRKRSQIRFDLVFLTAVALVLVLVLSMPRPQPEPVGSSDPVLNIPQPYQTTVPAPEPTTEPPVTVFDPVPLTFTAADEELIYVRSVCSGRADEEAVEEALLAELDWDLTDPSFQVLIIHSHISESYTKTADQDYSYRYGDPYRTDDEQYNMVAIGARVAEILRSYGIQVIHDTTSFENPNSDYAYSNARERLDQLLDEYPNIGLILDIHRDAVTNEDGTQWAPTVTVDGKELAQISMLIGYNGSYDRVWDRNLSFAVKLGAQLNQNVPDHFRQLLINSSETRYNQDMGPVSMLIEVGTAGNSLQEALNAAEYLAQAVADMAAGANTD